MTPPRRMPSHPSWQMMRQAINELYDTATCRCEDCWTGRDMHAPECQSDLLDHIETVDAYIEFLEQEALSLKQRIERTEEALKASLTVGGYQPIPDPDRRPVNAPPRKP